MLGPVVVGLDGSGPSLEALLHGLEEARWRRTSLHVVQVLDVTPAVLHLKHDVTITTRELAESDRAEIWGLAEPILDGGEVEVVRVERDGDPGERLVEYGKEAGASLLVVGPRGRGMVEKLFLGSTAEGVMRSASCDVLVVKSR